MMFGYNIRSKESDAYIQNLSYICGTHAKEINLSEKDIIEMHSDILVRGLFIKRFWQARKVQSILYTSDPGLNTVPFYREGLFYCPECEAEDLQKYGRRIYHVPHQIPWVNVCYKHKRLLLNKNSQEKLDLITSDEVRIAEFYNNVYRLHSYSSLEDITSRIQLLDEETVVKHIGIHKDALLVNIDYAFRAYNKAAINVLPILFNIEELFGTDGDICKDDQCTTKDDLGWIPDQFIIKEWFHPFISLYCKECGHTFKAYYQAFLDIPLCPICLRSLTEIEQRQRIIQQRTKGAFELINDSRGHLYYDKVTLRHSSCGTEITIGARTVIDQGTCTCPKCSKSKLGKEKQQKNGHTATIIRYAYSRDVDVQFEDGSVCQHVTYNSFKAGTIRHPNDKKSVKAAVNSNVQQ